jgi:DNA-binding XRE family transcriptional regulator/predicted RNase H-like HicB family nuclease
MGLETSSRFASPVLEPEDRREDHGSTSQAGPPARDIGVNPARDRHSLREEPVIAYPCIVRREGRFITAEFPDCPGCQTFVERGETIEPMAAEALQGWLELSLSEREAPPRPTKAARKLRGGRVIAVPVPPRLSIKLTLRWARQDAGLSQAALAKLLGVTQQAIAKVEHPDANPTLDTLLRVATALGMSLSLERQRPSVRRALGR